MSGEVFAVKCCKREWVPAGRGDVSPLAGLVEVRQHLKGTRANVNFKINLTTLPNHLHKLCLIPKVGGRREVVTIGNCHLIVFSVWLRIFTMFFTTRFMPETLTILTI